MGWIIKYKYPIAGICSRDIGGVLFLVASYIYYRAHADDALNRTEEGRRGQHQHQSWESRNGD